MSKIRTLSKTQERALGKLTDSYQSVYELSESISTLDSLVERKLAKKRNLLGASMFPHTRIEYKRDYP